MKDGTMKLQGRYALVTGAGSGIGQATALLFAQEGAHVIAADMNAEALQATREKMAQRGLQVETALLNVTDEEMVKAVVAQTVERCGHVDLLLNIAGIGSTQTAVDTDLETWERVFAVNVRGTFLMSKYLLPSMIQQNFGVIINMASVAGMVGLPDRAAYCASKAAVIGLTRAMAVDHVKQGIRVNAICPGTVDSPWVGRLLDAADDATEARRKLVARQPMGRLGLPEEIAETALYLASDAASFITGTTLAIDGGLTAQ
jgi:NAD(P)-dependent dehydrogenase (short-subunit alcohol dehydrogenase family)